MSIEPESIEPSVDDDLAVPAAGDPSQPAKGAGLPVGDVAGDSGNGEPETGAPPPERRTVWSKALASVVDRIALRKAPSSPPPSVILPDFLYLCGAASAAHRPHLSALGITHVINLAGCSNFFE